MSSTAFHHIREIASSRVAELEDLLTESATKQGSAHLALFHRQARFIRSRLTRITGLPEDGEEAKYTFRELDRLLTEIDVLHELFSTYRDDLRAGHPVGLLYLARSVVRDLAEAPLGINTEILIHIDAARNYSVQNLRDMFADTAEQPTSAPMVTDDSANGDLPIVLSVPGFDPYNAFLAPILAHEVSHVATDRSLLASLEGELGQRNLVSTDPENEGSTGSRTANDQLWDWLDEILCDSLAAWATGPSWLFALATFLPAPGSTAGEEHPSANVRAAWAWEALKRWGWEGFMRSQFPAFVDFVSEVAIQGGTPHDEELNARLWASFDAVMSVVEGSSASHLDVAGYESAAKRHELEASFERFYMPPNLAEDPPDAWTLLLAAWVACVRGSSGVDYVAKAVGDKPLNQFLIKSFELAGIAELWGEVR